MTRERTNGLGVFTEAAVEAVLASRAAEQRRSDALDGDRRERALFFSEAAHEFNTPLMIIALQAELLRGALGPVVPAQQRALGIIHANVQRLVRLSQDLADVARADAGRLVVQAVPVDVVRLVEEEVANFQSVAARQEVTIEVSGADGQIPVAGEPARLRQVVSNLLANAIKFTPPGGRVRLETSARTDGARVEVQDTGPGMDADDQARLFQPFVRIESNGAPTKPGTGLGLYLSKRIVEAHGGQVGCSSEGRGKGMTFWFNLPLADAVMAPQPHHATQGHGSRHLLL